MSSQTFTKSIEVRPVQGMDMGMFATEYIPQGTVIISESPLMSLPANLDNYAMFCYAYDNLSKDVASQVDELHANPKILAKQSSGKNWENFDGWYRRSVQNSKVDISTGGGLLLREIAVRRYAKAYTIFCTNAVEITGGRVGLYPTYCRINHSCDPNSRWTFEGNNLKVVAMRNIDAGEQIFVSYSWEVKDPEKNLNRNERRRVLQNWGFDCECERCTRELHEELASIENSPFAKVAAGANSSQEEIPKSDTAPETTSNDKGKGPNKRPFEQPAGSPGEEVAKRAQMLREFQKRARREFPPYGAIS
ncbi:SET domain-containing protein [Hypoxylon sp. FL0890]|nr:SET domain-containing protein [Hypoxylon sp. FL0890]